MKVPVILRKSGAWLVDKAKAINANTIARSTVAAGIAGGLALIGLHVSPDQILGIMTVAWCMGASGHQFKDGDQ